MGRKFSDPQWPIRLLKVVQNGSGVGCPQKIGQNKPF